MAGIIGNELRRGIPILSEQDRLLMKYTLLSTLLIVTIVPLLYCPFISAQDPLNPLPQGAKARVGLGEKFIYEIQYSPDGMSLMIVSFTGMYLYNLHTREKTYLMKEEPSYETEVAFTSDGQILATWHKRSTVHLWDVKTGNPLNTINAHKRYVDSVTFSPDGNTMATAGVDGYFIEDGNKKTSGIIHLWDVDTGKLLNTYKGHTEGCNGVAFSPDGNTLISSSWDETIRFWDVVTGTHKQTITVQAFDGVEDILLSPDGTTLASYSLWGGISLWDIDTGNFLKRMVRQTSDTDALYNIIFSPDGKNLVSVNGEGIRLWDVGTGNFLRNLVVKGGLKTSVSFSPDGKTIASVDTDGTVLLWDAKP